VTADLRHLRVVIAAAECGSFSSAALQINSDVSAISRTVRDLEEILGVALFERLPRGIRLTAAGDSYVASAREILARCERAAIEARLAGTGRALQLTIGSPCSATSKPFNKLLRSFAARSSDIAIEVVEADNNELINRIKSGRLDIALAATDPPPMPRLKELEMLSTRPLCWSLWWRSSHRAQS
jgi:DNA-binding transcriptional LysR family regulator